MSKISERGRNENGGIAENVYYMRHAESSPKGAGRERLPLFLLHFLQAPSQSSENRREYVT